MELTTAVLCDFAQVRDRLLFIASGGITRCFRSEFPAPLGVCLAVVIELDQVEADRPHEMRVSVVGQDGEEVASLQGGFQVSGQDLQIGEKLAVPMPFDLRLVGVGGHGAYDVKIYIDNEHRRTLTLWVVPPPTPVDSA